MQQKMSCNGCRILRKGCNDNCILRQSLSGIQTPQAQANATLFVAKFFGRSGLMSFLSAVPEPQRPALFESLLYEACGRTVNPINGAVGLLWSGKWRVCQMAVDTVLRGGGVMQPLPELSLDGLTEGTNINNSNTQLLKMQKRKDIEDVETELDLALLERLNRRAATPYGESQTTMFETQFLSNHRIMQKSGHQEKKLLKLFL